MPSAITQSFCEFLLKLRKQRPLPKLIYRRARKSANVSRDVRQRRTIHKLGSGAPELYNFDQPSG